MKRILTTLSLLVLSSSLVTAAPLGTAFSYQGRLDDGGNPANGSYDLRFTLFDTSSGTINVAGPLTNSAVAVSNGLFTVALDFGAGVFTGDARWLEIGVRTNGGGVDFTPLSPLQELTPTPYALYAPDAGAAAIASSAVAGSISNAAIAVGAVDSARIADGTIVAADVNAASFNTTFWQVVGNSSTTPGANYLGTTDNQALELKVNGGRALRLEPTTNAPNVIGGYSGNTVTAGVYGAVIGGGGTASHPGLGGPWPNTVSDTFGTIAGGLGNRIEGATSFIGGGYSNLVQSAANYTVIAGGVANLVEGSTDANTIGGGDGNRIQTQTDGATVAGGALNLIETNADFASIGGGSDNAIRADANDATVAGGSRNSIGANADFSFVGGGQSNRVDLSVLASVITGGSANRVAWNADQAVIGGGRRNLVSTNADYGTIGGGYANNIGMDADYGTIGGGDWNTIGTNNVHATIGGGWNNQIAGMEPGLASANTIAGGYVNEIKFGAGYSTVGGGAANVIDTNVNCGTISGGVDNHLYADRANIGGGWGNVIAPKAPSATIAGGLGNGIGTDSRPALGLGEFASQSFKGPTIAGGWWNLIGTNSPFSAISGGCTNTIAYNSWSATIAGGSNNVIQAGSTYATIGGGMNHSLAGTHGTIAGGEHHAIEAQASYTTIGGGSDNAIQYNADYSTIAGGDNHVIRTNATWATIGGGANNIIETNANYAVIPGGGYALASHYGQMAHASGRFASNGDAQSSVYVLRRSLSSATPSELFLNGANARMTVPEGSTWAFEALVVGRTSTGDSAGYRLTGVVENVGGGMSGSFQAPQVLREDVAAWDADATTDNVNDALVIRVTGTAGTTIRWVATVRTAEVSY